MVTAAKTTSQIVLHMGVAFGLMYAISGSIAFGGVAAILEPICNVILLPLHDKLWEKIRVKVENGPSQRSSHVYGVLDRV
ncbi:MAG TPA: hypothetical protein DHV59_02385 [Oxalobacteraceae bacterium]|nr:hypothetical protein [Oxalobacteraceae bacterium]